MLFFEATATKDESCSKKKIAYAFLKRNFDSKKRTRGLGIKKNKKKTLWIPR